MIVWLRKTPSNVAPMPASALRDRSLRACVLNSTRLAPSVSNAWVSWSSLASRLAPVRWNAVADPRPADLEAPVLGHDRHVAAAADRPAAGPVDRGERPFRAGLLVGQGGVDPAPQAGLRPADP